MWPIVAESGPAALKLLESLVEPVPLVLTDMHMPDMDGFELIKRIKAHSQIPTVIMLTSGSYPGDVARSRELGAEAYLIKPVRPERPTANDLADSGGPSSEGPACVDGGRGASATGRGAPLAGFPGLHVLVAEDNVINQRYALGVLEKEGYSAVVVGTGREALAAMERESFDLVLMDVQMPDMDGFEATSSIRARERFTGTRTPILAVTAHAMNGDRDKCLAAGMDAYVSKPIRKSELMAAIASLAANAKFGTILSQAIPEGLLPTCLKGWVLFGKGRAPRPPGKGSFFVFPLVAKFNPASCGLLLQAIFMVQATETTTSRYRSSEHLRQTDTSPSYSSVLALQ